MATHCFQLIDSDKPILSFGRVGTREPFGRIDSSEPALSPELSGLVDAMALEPTRLTQPTTPTTLPQPPEPLDPIALAGLPQTLEHIQLVVPEPAQITGNTGSTDLTELRQPPKPTSPVRPYSRNGTRDHQARLPDHREAILVRVPSTSLPFGPSSIVTLSTASSAPTETSNERACYHLCFVSGRINKPASGSVELNLWVCRGFSFSRLCGNNYVLALPAEWQARLLPIPFCPQIPPVEPLPTPADFGTPLHIGGFIALRPTFLATIPVLAKLTRGKGFKRFEPRVFLPEDEMDRIEEYSAQLSDLSIPIAPSGGNNVGQGGSGGAAGASGPNNDPGNNDGLPGPAPGGPSSIHTDQPSGYTAPANNTMHAVQPEGSEESDDMIILEDVSSGSENCSENELTFLEYAHLFAPQSPALHSVINDYNTREQATRADKVMSWLNSIEGH